MHTGFFGVVKSDAKRQPVASVGCTRLLNETRVAVASVRTNHSRQTIEVGHVAALQAAQKNLCAQSPLGVYRNDFSKLCSTLTDKNAS
mmetsp:Transcript_33635/g.70146  ORF Transcript_33635/g.70146 Transcript_33635/m.70146 type:complete len:88 (+) Transcript_33635:830-1093(+)